MQSIIGWVRDLWVGMSSGWLEFWADPDAIWIFLLYTLMILFPLGLGMGGRESTNYMHDDNFDE